MFPKATNSWTPLSKMSTKRYYSASVPVKGKLLLVLGEAMEWWQQTLPLVTHVCCRWQHLQHLQHWSSLLHPDTEDIWHQWHLKPWQFWQKQCLAVLPSTVQCMDNREVVLAVGGYEQSHCSQVLDYSQPKSQHGQQVITIHLYDCFIWLFCTIAWNHHILPKNYVVFYPASKRLMCDFAIFVNLNQF